jgi:putative ABC transport system permease protein
MRARQFTIATIGTALVFAMALVIAGVAGGFRAETRRSLEGIGGDGFVVPAGSGAPFTSFAVMPGSAVDEVRRLPGVTRADPVLIFGQRFRSSGEFVYGYVVAGPPGGLGAPPVRGLPALRHGEAVVDGLTTVKVGKTFTIGDTQFRAVRDVHGYSVLGGLPIVYISLADARAFAFSGRDVETAVAIRGHPRTVPKAYSVYTNDQARADVLRRLAGPIRTIDILQQLLFVVAAVIIGAVVYLSSLERKRDFAVLKAVGSTSRQLYVGLASQAVLMALLAAGVATALLPLLQELIPIPLAVPTAQFYLLPVVALVVGMLASLSGLRQAVRVDPALAFAG